MRVGFNGFVAGDIVPTMEGWLCIYVMFGEHNLH